ncbi:M28 family peptidase, partial [Candidatus Zixiibacteriota bacterium]
MRRIILCLFFLTLASNILSDDLYKITISDNSEIDELKVLDAIPLIRLNDGYLILLQESTRNILYESGLDFTLIAESIDKNRLALDNRKDGLNLQKFPLIYESDQLRLLQVDLGFEKAALSNGSIIPIRNENLKFEYLKESDRILKSLTSADVTLDSLVSIVKQDSLYSYITNLESYQPRVAGSDADYLSRDWLASQFQSFGYDSVVIDSFTADIYGEVAQCQNIIAYKIGSRFPDHQIVVGAHKDAVPGSPGADDNGSGTGGVLEVARALANIDTDMTFIFALFDAEEQGLHGSYHYVENAQVRGDSIVYMFNMDMIGAENNSTQANLFHGPETEFSELWISIAEPLVGIVGDLAGTSTQSDHYPFSQAGYEVTFLAEKNFSTVYHSANDLSSRMNFEYYTRMVKAALATVYTVSQTVAPLPGISFDIGLSPPEYLSPYVPYSLDINIQGVYEGVPVPGTGLFYYAINGSYFISVPLLEIGFEQYQATLPGMDCYDTVNYYFSMEEATVGTLYYPQPATPLSALTVGGTTILQTDNFETDQGWTTQTIGATSGFWERGIPVNDPGWGYDPQSDADGSGQCFLTENQLGNTDIDGGGVRLYSPVFSMTEYGYISYDYFLRLTNDNGIDRLVVYADDNGGNGPWYEIVKHDKNRGLNWTNHKITYADLIAKDVYPGPNMQLMFAASDGDPASIVEAGIDAFEVASFECTVTSDDIDNDGISNVLDNCPNVYNPDQSDTDTDGYGDVCDPDVDNDLIANDIDNCPTDYNPLQEDTDSDGDGDICDGCCLGERGNVDGSLSEEMDIADLVYLVDYQFNNGFEPPCL